MTLENGTWTVELYRQKYSDHEKIAKEFGASLTPLYRAIWKEDSLNLLLGLIIMLGVGSCLAEAIIGVISGWWLIWFCGIPCLTTPVFYDLFLRLLSSHDQLCRRFREKSAENYPEVIAVFTRNKPT